MREDVEQVDRYLADREFGRALRRGQLGSMASLLRGGGPGLPTLEEVRAILRPAGESYRGMQSVAVAKIVGSEGRSADFDRAFRPRRRHVRHRWINILVAHQRSVELPAVTLYEIGGLYFVRDGNHRVSVARHRGVQFIDAEVTSLSAEVPLAAGMSVADMRRAVLEHERRRYADALARFPPVEGSELVFTDAGGPEELISHVACHREALRASGTRVGPEEAARSWYEGIYLPLARLVRDAGVLALLPGRTAADVYRWLVRHWDEVGGLVADADRPARRDFLRRLRRR